MWVLKSADVACVQMTADNLAVCLSQSVMPPAKSLPKVQQQQCQLLAQLIKNVRILLHSKVCICVGDRGLMVWLCGNMLVSVSQVALSQARLIVTVCGQVHHLGM